MLHLMDCKTFENIMRNISPEILKISMPPNWSIAHVIPKIKNVNGSRTDPSNFRLVVHHLQVIGIVHSWIGDCIKADLTEKKIWNYDVQRAYGEGTLSAVKELMENSEKGREMGINLVFGFLDFKNAYGSINRDFILRVMREYEIPMWIQNYFEI